MNGYSPVQATPEFYVGQRVEYIAGPGYYNRKMLGKVGTVTEPQTETNTRTSTCVKWDDSISYHSAYNTNLRAVHGPSRAGMGWIDEGLSRLKDAFDKAVAEAEGGTFDDVTNPGHYNWIPGIECKDVVKHFPFMRGAAIKYLWRAGRKGDKAKHIQDLRKAIECITNELKDLENTTND